MSSKIRIKIDVTKLNKDKFFKGAKGTYCDLTLIPTQGDKYGNDFFIVQELGKGEDGKYMKGQPVGNGKLVGGAGSAPSYPRNPTVANTESEDVPF